MGIDAPNPRRKASSCLSRSRSAILDKPFVECEDVGALNLRRTLINQELINVRGNELVYQKTLEGREQAVVLFGGFGDSAKDTEMIIENKKAGAGMRITGDRPLIRDMLWSIRTVFAIDPYIAIDIEPGAEFTWKNMYEYYTLPAAN